MAWIRELEQKWMKSRWYWVALPPFLVLLVAIDYLMFRDVLTTTSLSVLFAYFVYREWRRVR